MTVESEHAVLGGRLILRQRVEGYRAAIDPILLAASVKAHSGQKILDLGTGIGTAALCVAKRCPGTEVTGLEIQPELVMLARQNTMHNGLSNEVTILNADITALPEQFDEASFDHVIANPPFFRADQAQLSPNQIKAVANVEGQGGLPAWLNAANKCLKKGGIMTVIHTVDRLADLSEAVANSHFGTVELFPLWPKAGRPAKRVILRCRKGGKGPSVLHSGLILHEAEGQYSDAADNILKNAGSLEF